MYIPDENQRTFLDVKRWIPYINIPHYEYHPKDKNMYRTHTPLIVTGKHNYLICI